nr:JmjC domain-containing protein [Tanacetum cinerariifolium]
MDPAGQAAAAAPSSSAISAADKGKAPMVDDSIPVDLLTEQERVLKNLHDYQLGEDLAKKLQAKQEAEFARQQEELAQKAQAKSVASAAAQVTGLSAQRQRELDAAQLIYTEADWLELMAKIATNSTLSKQLLGDDVNEDNMNERLGMLLMRKRMELAEQSRVKPMNKTQQRDFMRDFVKNQSASVYNQGWTMKQPKPTLEAPSTKRARQGVPPAAHAASSQVPATSSQVPAGVTAAPFIAADVSVFAVSTTTANVSAAPTTTTSIAGSPSPSVAEDPTTLTQEMVPTPFGSIHSYYDMEEHTKHFTSLRELLHMVKKNDLRRLLGDVDKFYQMQEHETFAFILRGDLRVLFQSLADEDAHAFWRDQESWRIRSWRLYPHPHVYVLETVDGRVIYMFVDVSYHLSEATLERMLRHGLEVPKLLVGGDLTMAEQLVRFIKAALLTDQSSV